MMTEATDDWETARFIELAGIYEDALQSIAAWSEAYPLAIFPEPDLKKAADLLLAGGISLDAVSASNMRHVIAGVGAIARKALHKGIKT